MTRDKAPGGTPSATSPHVSDIQRCRCSVAIGGKADLAEWAEIDVNDPEPTSQAFQYPYLSRYDAVQLETGMEEGRNEPALAIAEAFVQRKTAKRGSGRW